jgi:glycyl-tRNA synthetase alpha subunit
MKITFQEIKNIVELSHFGVTIQDTEKIMQYIEELKAENKRLLNANILLANERIRLKVSFFTHHCNFMNVIKVCDIKNLVHATEDIKQAESIYESISKLRD